MKNFIAKQAPIRVENAELLYSYLLVEAMKSEVTARELACLIIVMKRQGMPDARVRMYLEALFKALQKTGIAFKDHGVTHFKSVRAMWASEFISLKIVQKEYCQLMEKLNAERQLD